MEGEQSRFPYFFEELSDEDNVNIKEHFLDGSWFNDLVRVVDRESGCHLTTLNRSFVNRHHLVYNMRIRKDDVWVVTYPKCGTTWTQEMTWNIMNGVRVDKISEELFDRSPFIDIPMIENLTLKDAELFFEKLDSMPSPRTIKSHYPFELLPPALLDTCKVVYVCRNMKDACVSYFHHFRLFKSFKFYSTFDVFANMYRKGSLLQGGYFEMLRSGWKRRDHPNMLFFWYEEMKQDQKFWMMKIMNHIGYQLSKDKIEELCEALKFENFRKTSSMNLAAHRHNENQGQFLRKGIVGDWVNYFNREMSEDWDEYIRNNLDTLEIKDAKTRQYFQLNDDLSSK